MEERLSYKGMLWLGMLYIVGGIPQALNWGPQWIPEALFAVAEPCFLGVLLHGALHRFRTIQPLHTLSIAYVIVAGFRILQIATTGSVVEGLLGLLLSSFSTAAVVIVAAIEKTGQEEG